MKTKGFTLIELLVVISVIGLLSSIVLVSLNVARARARDVRRQSDIHQIMVALELYRNTNGVYPTSGGAFAPNGAWSTSNDTSWNTLGTALQPYISTMPHDPNEAPSDGTAVPWPSGGYNAYSYVSINDHGCTVGLWYTIIFRTESKTLTSPGNRMCDGFVYNPNSNSAYVTGVSQVQ